MRITTPTTIWSFLLGQLLRLLLLTAAVIVSVLAFVGSVRLLANGTLGVAETAMLAGWLAVPMMQYAMPFAGGFAATLVYHRMSQDNELTACYAGGLSHKTVLLPALAVGLVLGAGMFALADQVMPRFLRSAQEMITSDPSRLLASRLGKGQSMEMDGGRKLLYADELSEVSLPPGSRAFKQLVLRGVVALELDGAGNIVREVSSSVANVWLYRGAAAPALGADELISPVERWGVTGAEGTTAVMELRDPVGGKTGVAIGTVDQTVVAYRLPGTFRDKPKFLSWTELDRAWMNPQRITSVDEARRSLAQLLAERSAVDTLRDELSRVGRVTLIDGAGRPVTVRGSGVAVEPGGPLGFALRPSRTGGPVEISVVGVGAAGSSGPERVQLHRAARAWIGQASANAGAGTGLTLTMEEVSTTGEGSGDTPGWLSSLSISGLRPSMDPLAEFMSAPMESLQNRAASRLRESRDGPLERASNVLSNEVGDVRREIRSKQHERIASSLSCVVMVLLGSVMGMRLGSAPPLTVYLWSFLPALVGEMAISGGQTLAAVQGPVGLLLIYGGVSCVAVLAIFHYRFLARH